ncbi:MAG TPA: alpha/beta hydrolase [Verrucomicrobiae bacterium]|nr:alpha/beta hydrolase [Verrucomicrobiae bacterium]
MAATTQTLSVGTDELGPVPVTYTDRGEGKPFLLLHGGGGPSTVSAFADLLAKERSARVVVPIHPGYAGTPRPDSLRTVAALATLYASLLVELDLRGVTVVGNSMGGWIAAEMALLGLSRVSNFILIDAVGINAEGHPIADFFSMTPRQIAEASYRDPDKFGIDPAKLPPEARQAMAANRETLAIYAGSEMYDATLGSRLSAVAAPTLVLWGDSDRIVDPEYGRAFADAIPGAEFKVLTDTGHLPQIESPLPLLDAIWTFAESRAATGNASHE